jgi:membrane peptidoglycan carboxypeptidase
VESGGYGSITLREATQLSVNTVFAQLVVDVGVKETAEMAHRLGITMVDPGGMQANGDQYGPSLTLGAAEVSPLDMAAAYGVFAARGMQYPATPVVKVTDAHGKVLEDNAHRKGRRVLTEAVADNVTQVLQGVLTGGTGTGAAIGRPNGTAGKTGSTEDNHDAWFVGYTPALSTAIWMGYSDSATRSLRGIKGVPVVYGGTIPASTWREYMSQALKGAPAADFPKAPPLAGDIDAGARRSPEYTYVYQDPFAGLQDPIYLPPLPQPVVPTFPLPQQPPVTYVPPGALFPPGFPFTATTLVPGVPNGGGTGRFP